MAVKFDTVNEGDELLDVHSERAGNTTMRRQGVWKVRVLEVDTVGQRALVSWNGNPARWEGPRFFKKLRRFAPEWIRGFMTGRYYCHHCRAQSGEKDSSAHRPDCPHPKAVAWRKKNAA